MLHILRARRLQHRKWERERGWEMLETISIVELIF